MPRIGRYRSGGVEAADANLFGTSKRCTKAAKAVGKVTTHFMPDKCRKVRICNAAIVLDGVSRAYTLYAHMPSPINYVSQGNSYSSFG